MLRPGIVHRIDKDTTGALIVCKNDKAHQKIADQLRAHTITRSYRAIVYNNFSEDEGMIKCADWPSSDKPQKTYGNGKEQQGSNHTLQGFGSSES